MTYATTEVTAQEGNPYFLYTFTKGATITRFTSHDQDVTYSGNTYTASAIRHQGVNTTGKLERASVELYFPKSNTFAQTYFSPDYSDVITLTILRGHHTDADTQVMWKGRVISYQAQFSEIKITCESIQTTMRRAGLRGKYQRTCRHSLYSDQCGVSLGASSVTATVDAINGLSVTLSFASADETADDYFRGGILIKGTEYGYITSDVGNVVTLQYAVPGLAVSDSISVAPGCDLSQSTCNTKFNNILNFGGFPYIPGDNPFGGNAGIKIA